MAKKNKKVVIVDQELTPTVLATVENKKFNPLGLIVLFSIFGAVVYFLPEISMYVENYFNPVVNVPVNNNQNTPNNDEEEIVITKYSYSNTLEIKEKNIFSFNNFNIMDNKLTFNVNNSNNVNLSFAKYNYFLEIYNEGDTLLQRIQLKDIVVGANASNSVSYDLIDSNISYFTLIEIPVENYPAYVVQTDDAGNGMLVCTKGYETVNYILKDNKLVTIEDIFKVSNVDVNYSTLWTTYQSLAVTYNTINGVNSDVSITELELIFTTKIDLTINNNANISDVIYNKDTDAKVMRFELMANGYNCK